MKKLITGGCCIFFLQNFSHFYSMADVIDQHVSGKRALIKAIAAIVNTEAGRKLPQKRIYLPNIEDPQT